MCKPKKISNGFKVVILLNIITLKRIRKNIGLQNALGFKVSQNGLCEYYKTNKSQISIVRVGIELH
jgi:hypothetical protein